MNKHFPSKIILIGEYALIQGASGVALPYPHYSGEITTGQSSEKLNQFLDFLLESPLLSKHLDLSKLKQDRIKGLTFKSTIPQGSGLGSSGALCAAILYQYGQKLPTDINHIRDLLALMEGYYHGASSGIDPLISYVQKPVLIEKRNKVELVELKKSIDLGHFGIVNTDIERKTAPLVHEYIKKCETGIITSEKLNTYLEACTDASRAILGGDRESFLTNLLKISRFQYTQLNDFIPVSYRDQWLNGLETKNGIMKFCGAGGGGHLLCYGHNKDDLKTLFPNLMVVEW
jgi:mevalonate kinase